jgi:hypothetical protein
LVKLFERVWRMIDMCGPTLEEIDVVNAIRIASLSKEHSINEISSEGNKCDDTII